MLGTKVLGSIRTFEHKHALLVVGYLTTNADDRIPVMDSNNIYFRGQHNTKLTVYRLLDFM